MVSVAVKSLWARKLRALGTTVAVFVGVSLIAGTYVITDTINRAFDQIFSDSLKGTSVVITNKQPVTQQTNTSISFPAGVLKKVQAVPGVKLASGTIFTGGGILKGDQEVGSQFAPKFISAALPPQIETLKTVEGHRPANSHEATLDKAAADDAGLSIGDPIRIAGSAASAPSGWSGSPSSAAPRSGAPASPSSRSRRLSTSPATSAASTRSRSGSTPTSHPTS